MSDRSLTGYDNTDVVSGQPDEEVYLYDARRNHVVCVSCNPTGARPRGVFDAGEGAQLLVDHSEQWKRHWLAGSIPGWTPVDLGHANYQSRYLSDNGRLFFDSPDLLVPQDTNGKENVYEYEPPGEGDCETTSSAFDASAGGCLRLISSGTSSDESAFLDASASGNDVFFLTAARLVPQDVDSIFDVYDAHVCAATQPCLTAQVQQPPSCGTAEACRAPFVAGTAIFGVPATANLSGNGNLAPGDAAAAKPVSRARLLAMALKACRKMPRKKRVSCERRARRRYHAVPSRKRAIVGGNRGVRTEGRR
jgi:hypothetical protein